jgi:hypothetical protein
MSATAPYSHKLLTALLCPWLVPSGEENLSVIVAPIMPGFSLESMGSPDRVASQFLGQIAAEGSGRAAVLLASSSRQDSRGQLYYEVRYNIFLQPENTAEHKLMTVVLHLDVIGDAKLAALHLLPPLSLSTP